MKKYSVCFLMMIVIFVTATFTGNAWAKPKYVMKLASGSAVRDYWSFTWTPKVLFKQEVERRSKGQIEVKWYPRSQLGSIEQVIIQTRQGLVQGCSAEGGHFATLYPNIQIFSIPYLFYDRQIAWEIMQGKVAKEIRVDMTKKVGLRPLGFLENGGFRNFSDSKHPLRTPKDLKGLKIRTMNIPLHMEIVKNLGASPTPINWSELYSSLQTGVVDGQENSVPTFRIPKLEEVQKYMILDGHVFSFNTFLLNEKWFQSLPKELQGTILQSYDIAGTVQNALSVLEEKKDIDWLKKKGLDIYTPPISVKAEFRKLTQGPAIKWLRNQKGIDNKMIDQLLEEVQQVERKWGYE